MIFQGIPVCNKWLSLVKRVGYLGTITKYVVCMLTNNGYLLYFRKNMISALFGIAKRNISAWQIPYLKSSSK